MEPLNLEGTADTPRVTMDGGGKIVISGRSLPENAFEFYAPLIQWLEDYSAAPASATLLHFDLEYFNTSSARQLYKLINLAKELSSRSSLSILWYYDEGDKDMRYSGERYARLCEVEIGLIEK